MQWAGKILGAFLGLMVAGPVGLFVGMLIGHFFDMGLFTGLLRKHAFNRFNPGSNQRDAFFQSIFQLMGYLAKSDGHVSQAELAVAKEVMSNMNLNATLRQQAIDLFQAGKESDFNPHHTIQVLRFRYGRQPNILRMCHDILQKIARADGVPINPKKASTLNQLAQALGVMPFNFNFNDFDFSQFGGGFQSGRQGSQQHRRPHFQQPTHTNPYTILGISKTASNEEVKKSYRRLMSQYHPDKLVSKNLSKEEMAKATEKTQEIKSAYEQLRREREF